MVALGFTMTLRGGGGGGGGGGDWVFGLKRKYT